MSEQKPPFVAIVGGGKTGAKNVTERKSDMQSPEPPPELNMSARESRVWDYICENLRAAGLDHVSAGLTISIVVKTYVRWLDAEKYLAQIERENRGTYFVKTPNGHEQPHQAFYVVKNLKQELLKWLPESCLTIPSAATVKSKLGEESPQDDLFDGLVGHAKSHPSAA